jgi:hypothetical protein
MALFWATLSVKEKTLKMDKETLVREICKYVDGLFRKELGDLTGNSTMYIVPRVFKKSTFYIDLVHNLTNYFDDGPMDGIYDDADDEEDDSDGDDDD